ncbi:MAG TPA: BID domain-containing protein, partial [Acidisoma sp.]|nr:BID domain-containing protein [Acidisoma sp.]
AASGQGREVVWSASEFDGFRHGYAGTIYKGQGRTLDHTYLYHTHHWRSAASYVALTRQRESAQVFVATETARDAAELARQMARGEIRAASVAWATVDELAPELRVHVAQDEPGERPARKADAVSGRATEAAHRQGAVVQRPATESAPTSAQSTGKEERGATEFLIPAYVDPRGRDSLGRGLDADSIADAVAADRTVQQERDALPHYLRGAYRDPHAAKAQLDEMVKRQGWASTAARIAQDPDQLGALRGRVGFFAGTKAKAERVMAERAAAAVAPSLERIATAEARAAQGYREGVGAQRKADATPIPKLTARAEMAVAALAAAADEKVRAELWNSVTADKAIGAEVQRFSAAVRQRFGDDAVRVMLRSRGGSVEAASVSRQHHAALAAVSRTMHAIREGEQAGARRAETARLSQRQTLGYRRGLKP